MKEQRCSVNSVYSGTDGSGQIKIFYEFKLTHGPCALHGNLQDIPLSGKEAYPERNHNPSMNIDKAEASPR